MKELRKEDIQNEMINIMAGLLAENNICSFCPREFDQDETCNNSDLCFNCFLTGIENQAKRNLRNK